METNIFPANTECKNKTNRIITEKKILINPKSFIKDNQTLDEQIYIKKFEMKLPNFEYVKIK